MSPSNPFMALQNEVLLITLTTWGLAQLMKPLTGWLIRRKWDWGQLFSTGGMPSSHTTLVVSATLATGLVVGFNSPLFAISTAFSMVVIADAAGVRREAGFHAQALNAIIRELMEGQPLAAEKELREVLGHTPLEVLGGIIWATLATTALWYFWH
jgi:acid phosphatase family membrane protein YuiD